MASSSSLRTPHQKEHEVFISFRGEDVRIGFLSHLQEALTRQSIHVFVDEKLDRGKEITPALLKEIENSYVSVVIFSKNYADSQWCLDELEKIMECKKTMGQIVLPVFYQIDPTHVQNLTGSFGDAIAEHRKEFKDSLYRVNRWCQALKETAGMAGFVSDEIGCDSKLIEKIVNWILEKLNYVIPSVPSNDRLVGIDSRAKHVESLLCLEVADVRIVGICGMGGIGKTTIAKEVFRRISDHFTSRCFIENVREKLEKGTLDSLQSEILSKLFGLEHCNGNPMMSSSVNKRWLSRKQVLIILDDASHFDQIENLIGSLADYGLGSRIIMTSRDKQVLRNKDAEMYEVEKLNYSEAHQLFNLHAFKQIFPREEYRWLSEAAVKYAQGIPLALKVLGSNLYKKSVKEWEDELKHLESTSDDQIQRVLRRSYDGLSENDKEIFLDIACFFDGEDRNQAVDILDAYGSNIGISRLDDKCLISIANNWLHMHDLLKQMGKDIINEEKKVGKRRWLWRPEDIEDVLLARAKGTEAIKGILLDTSNIRGLELSPTAFEGMYKLRVLKFYDPFFDYVFPSEIKVSVPSGLKFLSDDLRFLHWDGCPLRSLPSDFFAENLVEVHLSGSQLKELWNGVQQLGKLKLIDLSKSHVLMRIPDLSKATNLEVLRLNYCTSLFEIGSSLQRLSKLKELDLSYCGGLYQHQHQLLNFVHLKSLEILNLSGWSSITEFPKVPRSIINLLLVGTGIKQVPSSIECLSHLSELDLSSCTKLESLPHNICNLEYLETLCISNCVKLHGLPENLGNLKSLLYLYASGTGIKKLPPSFNQLTKLRTLDFNRSEGLKVPFLSSFANLTLVALEFCGLSEFPRSLCYLESLKQMDLRGNNFESIPEIIEHSKITFLDLSDCKRLKYLPELPYIVNEYLVKNCKCLKSAAILFHRPMIDSPWWYRALKFDNCFDLDPNECDDFLDGLLAEAWENNHRHECKEIFHSRLALRIPGSELPRRMIHKNNNGSFLNLSFREPQCYFTLCVVFDPDVYHGELARIGCTVRCKDESGYTQEYQLDYVIFNGDIDEKFNNEYDLFFHSKHVFLWRCHQYIPWNKVEFQFFAKDEGNDEFEYRSYDAIVKCAVQTLLEKEEPFPKRLKRKLKHRN